MISFGVTAGENEIPGSGLRAARRMVACRAVNVPRHVIMQTFLLGVASAILAVVLEGIVLGFALGSCLTPVREIGCRHSVEVRRKSLAENQP